LVDATIVKRSTILAIIIAQIALYLVIMVYASFQHPEYRFQYYPEYLWSAVLIGIFSSAAGTAFAVCQFSFGYAMTYYFFLMIIGFLWINGFSALRYDHLAAGISASVSAIGFGLPALLIRSPLSPPIRLSFTTTKFLVSFAIGLSVVVILVGVRHNFYILGLRDHSEFRDELFHAKIRSTIQFPVALRYSQGIVSSALMPFAFAFLVERKQYWLAATALVLMACLFPITLTKTSLFQPLWLVFVALIATMFEARTSTVLIFFIPTVVGLVSKLGMGNTGTDLFDILDLRLLTIPSAALSFYNEFFAQHEQTLFCQIGIVKLFFGCPYQEQLGVVMEQTYGLGNYNASLFATEGVASVGLMFAPISAFVCGLLVGLANRMSAGLPPRFVLISSAILTQMLLNVPFSTAFLTHGAVILFLMWYLLPREIFVKPSPEPASRRAADAKTKGGLRRGAPQTDLEAP
jgi:hypothetical protein